MRYQSAWITLLVYWMTGKYLRNCKACIPWSACTLRSVWSWTTLLRSGLIREYTVYHSNKLFTHILLLRYFRHCNMILVKNTDTQDRVRQNGWMGYNVHTDSEYAAQAVYQTFDQGIHCSLLWVKLRNVLTLLGLRGWVGSSSHVSNAILCCCCFFLAMGANSFLLEFDLFS